MPNIHKAICILNNNLKNKNKKEAHEYLSIILNSYSLQMRYSVPMLNAFVNSIYTPTTKKNESKEQKIKHLTKLSNNEKYRTIVRYEEIIMAKRKSAKKMLIKLPPLLF